ncbi:MAG: endonuclease/exonuclease/phosphatase family protein, partial [Verrucomicrobiota bacterium]
FITLCVIADWDWASPITIFPFWCWAILGGIATFAALRLRCNRWHGLVLVCLWLASVIWFSDNLSSLWRLLSNPKTPSGTVLRIVTLNCAGNSNAAREVIRLKPDIVLLQEIPRSTNVLTELGKGLFGDEAAIINGYDCAILARGRFEEIQERQPQYVQAALHLPSAHRILITSLRLVPPVARLDLWNPNAWRASIANRRLRRQQLLSVLERDQTKSNIEILGGDFNTTANDTTLRLLSEFEDAHHAAGRGWGNTMLNNIPIARPDQIWVRKLRVISAQAIKTKNSDHQLVLVLVEIPADK